MKAMPPIPKMAPARWKKTNKLRMEALIVDRIVRGLRSRRGFYL
jgi:hypothetical protein